MKETSASAAFEAALARAIAPQAGSRPRLRLAWLLLLAWLAVLVFFYLRTPTRSAEQEPLRGYGMAAPQAMMPLT